MSDVGIAVGIFLIGGLVGLAIGILAPDGALSLGEWVVRQVRRR